MEKLLIVDGYNLIFRAYYKISSSLMSPEGVPTSGVFGFINILLKHLEEIKPSHLLLVFDSGKPNFRHQLFADYKAKRPALPADLIVQFPILREFACDFGIATLDAPGYEADDMIASAAWKFTDIDKIILTSDKDLLQLLLYPRTKVYDPVKNQFLDESSVLDKFKVHITQLLDYFALIGDQSDGVPGVPGVGPKTACELLEQFGTLDNILANSDSIKPERKKNLIVNNKEQALLSRRLIALESQANIPYSLQDLCFEIKSDGALAFLQKYGFKSLVNRIAKFCTIKETIFHKEASEGDYPALVKSAETEGEVFCFLGEVIHLEAGQVKFSTSDFNSVLPLLMNPEIIKVSYDCKKIFHQLSLSYQEKWREWQDLKTLYYSIFTSKSDIETLREKFAPDEKEATGVLHQSYSSLKHKLFEDKLTSLYELIERPLVPVLTRMEELGILVDAQLLLNLTEQISKHLNLLEHQIYQKAGEEFLIASNKQLGSILFDKLKLPGAKKLKSGIYATSSDVLEQLKDYEITEWVLQWRHLAKLKSTYAEALPTQIDSKTGRIHTTYIVDATSTGRISSQNPNLQNIPVNSGIREAFISKPGYKLLAADYSQIELRILASMANVSKFIQAFDQEEDIHLNTAHEVFGAFPTSSLKDYRRRQAKTINFGIIYGQSPFGLSKQLGIPVEEAANYIHRYFERYPEILTYMENIKNRNEQFVTTMFGRRCYVNGLSSNNYQDKRAAQRAAINAPLQGTAADIIKLAMVKIFKKLGPDIMLLQVHDELIFEIPEGEVEYYSGEISKIMEEVVSLPKIKLKVDISIGNNWGKMQPL